MVELVQTSLVCITTLLISGLCFNMADKAITAWKDVRIHQCATSKHIAYMDHQAYANQSKSSEDTDTVVH